MASPAQIAANRLNAQKSTGPRSTEGKSTTRFNALKSGIDAKSLVIPGEDPAELSALAANYYTQFEPASPVEQFLVDCLIRTDWQLRRLHKAEAHLWQTDGDSPSPSLLRLCRLIDARERAYFRDIKELRRLQAARQSAGETPAEESLPVEIGFDPSTISGAEQPAAISAQAPSPAAFPGPGCQALPPSKQFDPRALRL
jgi:hypothetical protein